MEKSLYLKTFGDELFAVVNNVRRTDTLLSVRERLGNTGDRKFDFLLYGISLKAKQESKTLVQDCSTIDKSNGNVEISIKISDTQVTTEQVPEVSACYAPETETLGKVSTNEFVPLRETDEKEFRGCQTTPEQVKGTRKVHQLTVYTEEDISEATGLLSKQKMRFHNNMMASIEKDHSLHSWMTQELLGVIESSWVMKRTELLKLEVKELVINKPASLESFQEKSMLRNLEEVEKSHFDVAREYEKFCADLDRDRGKRQVLEKKFDEFFSTLKQCQGKLIKSIESFIINGSKVTPSDLPQSQEKEDTFIADALSENEIANLVEDIQTEYESN